ncbi:MAG: DUF3971 domain-containing protein [Desulfuromonadales bacterium]|nr:MAG: DUF3971 domain-containing protein [Desulfuromonadales bacterium]
MTQKSLLKCAAGVLVALALAAAAAAILIPRLLDLEAYRGQILSVARKSLSRPVSCQSASISWHFGPIFSFTGIVIDDKTGGKPLLTADRLSFSLDLLPLLHKQVRLQGIEMERPVLELSRDEAGLLNISDLFTAKPSGSDVQIRAVRIRRGLIRFRDRFMDPAGLTTTLENLELNVSSLARGTTSDVKLSTLIPESAGGAELSLSGTVRIPSAGKPLGDAKVDLALAAKKLDAGRYWPYYGRYLPFERVRGYLDLEGDIRGSLAEFTTKGSLRVRDLRLHYPQVFHATLEPKELQLTCDVGYDPRRFTVNSLDLTLDGLRIQGSCALEDMHTSDPRIRARATTSSFALEEFRRYIPFGVIPRDTADFIEQRIKGGVFRLEEGKVDGRLSQLRHMESGNNAAALFVRARVDKGVLTLGPQVPELSAISGELEMKGTDFALHRMTGTFGSSPFTLEGKIAGYPLDTPSEYPATITMTPTPAEVAWLFRREDPRTLPFSGPSTLALSGTGTAADYRITGSWDLSRAAYRIPRLVDKPAGLTNRVAFSGSLGKSEARLTELHYVLPPLDLTANATYRYEGEAPLTFAISTNQFMLSQALPLFPELNTFHPGGKLHVDITGKGNPAQGDTVRVKGALSLAGFSLRPPEQIAAASGIDGTIDFTESSLETGQLTGRVGDTSITLKGSVANFSDPAVALAFASPLLHLKDLGFHAPGDVPQVKDLSGTINLKKGNLTIGSLSGEVERTPFTVQGEVQDLHNPKITLRVDLPSVRVEDLEPLTRLKRAGTDTKSPGVVALQARVTAGKGSFRDITFEKLATDLSLDNDRLDIRSMDVTMFGGKVAGSGKADFAAAGGPLYQATFSLDQVDAARLLTLAGREDKITGRLSAEGELSARGSHREQLKKTVRGGADITLSEGTISSPASAGQGNGGGIPLKELQAHLYYTGKVLEIPSARIEAFGGVTYGYGTADFRPSDGPHYTASCQMESIDAANLFSALGVTKDITGRMTLLADLTARGDSGTMLKKSLQGSLGIELEKGVINKFMFLSKVFSILNVSQLLDFRLPDMVSSGMPYDRIAGGFSFNEGSAVTNNLFMKSTSINVTVVGKSDLVKEELDVKVGVQPLQTVGKFVRHLPVIGWILTGGDKSFLVTFYEARGPWNNPTVTAIPVTSLSQGVFNIFKRTFSLPDKLITDPRGVFMDK